MSSSNGIMPKARSVDSTVMAMDSATSPFEYRVKRLDVLPPGVQPIATMLTSCVGEGRQSVCGCAGQRNSTSAEAYDHVAHAQSEAQQECQQWHS